LRLQFIAGMFGFPYSLTTATQSYPTDASFSHLRIKHEAYLNALPDFVTSYISSRSGHFADSLLLFRRLPSIAAQTATSHSAPQERQNSEAQMLIGTLDAGFVAPPTTAHTTPLVEVLVKVAQPLAPSGWCVYALWRITREMEWINRERPCFGARNKV
jgi:hypothetical protein